MSRERERVELQKNHQHTNSTIYGNCFITASHHSTPPFVPLLPASAILAPHLLQQHAALHLHCMPAFYQHETSTLVHSQDTQTDKPTIIILCGERSPRLPVEDCISTKRFVGYLCSNVDGQLLHMRCYVGSLRHPSVDGRCDIAPRVPRAWVFARPAGCRIRWTSENWEESCLVHARDDRTIKGLFRVHSDAKVGNGFGRKLVCSCALGASCIQAWTWVRMCERVSVSE